MFKYILWDIDGTILNFKEAEKRAILQCFKELGLGLCSDEMLSTYSSINDSYWKSHERGEISKGDLLIRRFEDFFRVYSLEGDAAKFNNLYQIRLGDTAVYNDDIKPFLLKIKNNYPEIKQCAVTNGTAVAQERKLKNSGLDRILDYVFISEKVGTSKPDKEFFERVFELLLKNTDGKESESFNEKAIDRDEVIIVGDSLTSDIKGGMNAGIKTCYYNPDKLSYSDEYRVDYEISNLNELENILF